MMKLTFTDQIRKAMEDSGLTRYRIAKETGIPASQLCRFAHGMGLHYRNLDTLAELLDLHVVVGKPKTSKKGAK